MKTKLIRLACLLTALLALATEARAQGTAFTYQGRLDDAAGPAGGTYNFQFTVRDALTDGNAVGVNPLAATLAVSNGLFTATLDPGAGVFTAADRWLEIAVRTNGAAMFTTLSPRQKITAAPYAVTAGAVAGAEPPSDVNPVIGMAWIKPGTFIMGSRADEPGRDPDEGPQTVVTLTKGFWMGVHEVTQGEYLAVIGSNPSGFPGDLNRPVETVSWNNATNYCRVLTTSERAAGHIPVGWGYRLPTEAEWEYACRAGARTTRFCYDDDLSATALGNYAWYFGNSANTTHPVGQKQSNPWGLMDMHGNVREWCQDEPGTYPGGSVTDPQGPGTGFGRMFRGGSWYDPAVNCRSANRLGSGPDNTDDGIGFRVVLAPGQPRTEQHR